MTSALLLLLLSLVKLDLAQAVPLYGRYEIFVALEGSYNNPFNYSEVAVQAKLTGPDGQVTVDGFYYQAYTRSNDGGSEKLTPDGEPHWCIRYAPRKIGTFQVAVTVTNSSGTFTIQTDSFTATEPADSAGFIEKSMNEIHFQFTNGSTYYPIGENVCWDSYSTGTYGYDNYFGKLADNGGNYARLWLTDVAWDGLAVQIGVAKMSLPDTWRLDYVVQLAEQLKMHLLMCTESFNYFCTKSPSICNWNICYYNIAYGGFLSSPEEFFTNEEARNDYKNRLRYLVARYGYSTSVFAWEFFNEIDGTDNYVDGSSVQVDWIKEMSSYLRSVDVYGHLISNSYANSDGDKTVQGLSALDFTMTHNYGSSDIAGDTAQYPIKKIMLYKKPSYVAEFGIGDETQDKAGVSLHNGVWAPLFSLGAGTCMTWWWDSWVDPNNLYGIFKPFAQFVSHLPLASFSWSQSQPSVSGSGLRVWGMVGDSSNGEELVVCWVQDECHTWSNQHNGQQCNQQSGIQVVIPGCKHASNSWNGYWYDTNLGTLISTKSVSCSSGNITDTAPTFTGDIAVYYSFNMD